MHWIIQENFKGEPGWQRLVDSLKRRELPHSIVQIIPFVGEMTVLNGVAPNSISTVKVICIGMYSMKRTADLYDWKPGVFDMGHLSHSDLHKHWGNLMLNSDGLELLFKDVPEFWSKHSVVNGDNDYVFLRPAFDTKQFNGKVYGKLEFNTWYERIVDLKEDYGSTMTGNTPVVISKPKPVYKEARLWVVDGKIVTSSYYKLGGSANFGIPVDPMMIEFGKYVLKSWTPPVPAFVLDVCLAPDGPRIVEAQTMNCAGFYEADMDRLVAALEDWAINFRDNAG